MDRYNLDMLYTFCLRQGTALNADMLSKLSAFCDMVLETNKKFNLTAITEEEAFAVKHFADSLSGAGEIPAGATVCDIGAGAGFPSVPLAIARPDITVTALDSTAKKMDFVQTCAGALGITNIKCVTGRAEECTALRGTFDAVMARAVASLPILLELAAPLLKIGGVFVAYKSDESELEQSKSALKVLNMTYLHTKALVLPNGDNRAILVFKKTAATPLTYPRAYGAIKKRPL